MACGIYRIENLINNKSYIGQSNDIERRLNHHKLDYLNKNKSTINYPIYAAMRKYGINNFNFSILELCDKEFLNEKEIYYISKFNSVTPNGYNQTYGGQNPHISKLSKENIKNIMNDLKNTNILQKELAIIYGVHYGTICDINVGKTWHMDIEYPIRKIKRSNKYCKICGKLLSYGSKKCNKCRSIDERHVERPEKIVLAKMIFETSFTEVALKYGVSSTSIKKWCLSYGIPHLKKDLISWYLHQNKIYPMWYN